MPYARNPKAPKKKPLTITRPAPVITPKVLEETKVRKLYPVKGGYLLVDDMGANHFVEDAVRATIAYNQLTRQGAVVEVFKLVKLDVEIAIRFKEPS